MAEPHPTNQHIMELLRRLEQDMRELKQGQQQLTAEVRKLADSPEMRS